MDYTSFDNVQNVQRRRQGAPREQERMNKKLSRESLLLNMLNSTGRITTGEAVALLGVSEATARRTFTNLEKSGRSSALTAASSSPAITLPIPLS